ncbi:MAG TPA: response regulator transcription factor [Chloroflexota bacterium]|jgi:DNA-binding NarL/FixJ family response regulator
MNAKQGVQKTRPARLVLADDHELARAGMRAMLMGERGLEVVGEADTGQAALTLCRRLHPDLALIDVRMPELDGLAVARQLREECPQTKVLIVTVYLSPEYLLEALKAGAAGYILKEASRAELLDAIRRVLRGETILNGDLATALLRRLTDPQPNTADLSADHLTPREREVLQLIAEGYTNRAIASSLYVSAGTVKIHVEHIIGKLQATDRTQAAIRAVQLGLLNPEGEQSVHSRSSSIISANLSGLDGAG